MLSTFGFLGSAQSWLWLSIDSWDCESAEPELHQRTRKIVWQSMYEMVDDVYGVRICWRPFSWRSCVCHHHPHHWRAVAPSLSRWLLTIKTESVCLRIVLGAATGWRWKMVSSPGPVWQDGIMSGNCDNRGDTTFWVALLWPRTLLQFQLLGSISKTSANIEDEETCKRKLSSGVHPR